MATLMEQNAAGEVSAPLFLDLKSTGSMRIAGTVTKEGEPARRPVLLIHRASRKIISERLPAADGSYEFVRLRPGKYAVLALDTNNEFDAAVSDMIEPVLTEE